MGQEHLEELARLIRHDILMVTNRAGSGHPTSSLSAVDLMVGLLFGGQFRYNIHRPEHPNNDRLIFSKGHASPLLYALWAAAGALRREELFTYRSFGSRLEGHPTPRFPHVDAATGSLGQGLSVGLGLALNARFLDRLPYRTFVLLGDSEMTEGSQWEALQVAAHYELDNIVGILDVNRLGQRGETLYGHDLEAYARRVSAFGWEGIAVRVIDLYSVKPIDEETLRRAAKETRALITVEDHYAEGGLGEAVAAALPGAGLHILAVRKTPRSGRPEELLDDQDISRGAIMEAVKTVFAEHGEDREKEKKRLNELTKDHEQEG